MEQKIKHLEFIQGVVNRLSNNSFLLKGWSVALVAALVALGAELNYGHTYLALIPAVVFWGLDGYFVWQERLYRKLYDRVRTTAESAIDFSMDTKPVAKEAKGWFSAAFWPPQFLFHGVLIFAILILMFLD